MSGRSRWSPTTPSAGSSSDGCAKFRGGGMADTFESRTITVRIARPRRNVYDFTAVPENFPRWASGLGRSLKSDGEWIADTPAGRVRVRFTASNDFGVLD